MGSSRTLLCCAASVLVLLCCAAQDEHLYEQREVRIMQEIVEPHPDFMLQQELDPKDLLDLMDTAMMSPAGQSPHTLSERGQPGFGPRSFDGPPVMQYPVQFPLARPTSGNLQAICLHGDRRPLYPDSYFPSSGFSQQKRRASAVNNAESWFRTCCEGRQTWGEEVMLCCATQAWELSVESFCEEDTSVKDRVYHCCKLSGSSRLNCFNKDSPNPNYEPTEELPLPPFDSAAKFNFDFATCQRTVMTPYRARGNRRKKVKKPSTSQKTDISFPPGRPTAETIDSLCRNQRLRPLYNVNCLPGSRYKSVAHQAKTVNRIEKGFKQCCKNNQDVLNCAEEKWREELDRFCSSGNGKQEDFPCCSPGEGPTDRYSCFHNMSPDPHYNVTSGTEEFSLDKICDAQKVVKKKLQNGFPLVTQCCPLSEQNKTICFEEKLKETSERVCLLGKAAPPVFRKCCRMPSEESPQCLSKLITNTISKAVNVLRQKKRKRCPLS